jgi:hypothetical protein
MDIRVLDDNSDPPWAQLAPHVDDGLNHLNASDRDAMVLRFLKQRDLRAVCAALGISEDAAQKRVTRALERLRGVLRRRGVAVTAAALASSLAAGTNGAASAGLVAAGGPTGQNVWDARRLRLHHGSRRRLSVL